MPFNWDGFVDEAQAVIRLTWPEVTSNGIFEFDEVVRSSWERRTFPFSVFDMPAASGGADWGLGNIVYEPVFEVHRLARESETQAQMRGKLMLLQNAMLAAEFTDARCLDVADINWSSSHPAMAVFHGKNIAFRGGSIGFLFICGAGFNE